MAIRVGAGIRSFLLILLLAVCCGIGWRGGHDLEIYYGVAQRAASGNVLAIYPENMKLWVFCYGPATLALLKPLALLSFHAAHWLWLALEAVAFVAFWRGLARLFPSLNEPRALPLWILVWILSIKPIHATFQCFNIQLFIMAALCWAELWSEKDDWRAILAGGVVSLLSCVKLYPGFIAAYYGIARGRRVRLGILAGLLFSAAIVALAFGMPATLALHRQFLHSLHDYHDAYSLSTSSFNLSLPSLLAFWLPHFAQGLLSAASILIVGGAFYGYSATHRDGGARFSRDSWALAVALMALVNPSTRADYFIFFVPAFAALAVRAKGKSLSRLAVTGALVAFVLLAFLTEWVLRSRALNHQLEAWRVPVVGMLLLCLVLALSLRYHTRYAPTPDAA